MFIGIVGEHPNDSISIQNLLSKKYDQVDFDILLKNIHGSQLDNQKTKRLLRIEYEDQNPDHVIFVRDLDALESDKEQIAKRKVYFSENNSVVDAKGVFLLNVFEIEALICADIDTFNEKYGTNIVLHQNPSEIIEPKEFLKTNCKKYNESDNSDLFLKLEYDKLKVCERFKQFSLKLDKIISNQKDL